MVHQAECDSGPPTAGNPFGYPETVAEAEERHRAKNHYENTGYESWETCPALVCRWAREHIGTKACPTCGGSGRVFCDA